MNLPWLSRTTQIKDVHAELWTRVCWICNRQGEGLRSTKGVCEVVKFSFKELAQRLRCHYSIEPVVLPRKLNVRCV